MKVKVKINKDELKDKLKSKILDCFFHMLWHISEKLCVTNTPLYNLHLTGCWSWWMCVYFHIALWCYGSIPKAAAFRVSTLHQRFLVWVVFYLSGLNSCTNRQIRMKQWEKQETGLWPQSGALLLLKPNGMLEGGGTQPLPPLSPTCVQVRRVYKGVFLWMETDSGSRSHWDLCHKLSDFLQKDGETARALPRSQPHRLRLENYT